MVTKTASQTAAPEPDPSDDDDRARAPFAFQQREIDLYEPMAGQRFILLQTIGVTDEGADSQEQLELVLGFATMLRSLFVSAADRQAVTGALARGDADLEDYFDLAKQMAEHWAIESEPATRADRRARERRPAKAVARPRSTRPR